MLGNRKGNVIVWVVFGIYLVLALLPTGAVIHCIAEPGHSAIEFTHKFCSQDTRDDASVRQGETFSEQESGCTDTEISLSAVHLRKKSNLVLPILSRTLLGIFPNLTEYHLQRNPVHNIFGRPRQDLRSIDLLGTVILLI